MDQGGEDPLRKAEGEQPTLPRPAREGRRTTMSKLAIMGGSPVRTDAWPQWPYRDERDAKAIEQAVLEGDWGGFPLPNVCTRRFQEKFAALHDCAHALCVANGTVSFVRCSGLNAPMTLGRVPPQCSYALGRVPPEQMCDALDRNVPQDAETLLANCLAHRRRYFVKAHENFPEECRHVLEEIGKVKDTSTCWAA